MKTNMLIGNGLNRTLEHSIAWSDLLKDISEELHTNYYGDISLPLEFERIINEYLTQHKDESENIYSEVKRKVANKIQCTKLPEDSIHKRLLDIPVNSILTTNYDYLLEYVYNPSFNYNGSKNKKYLFNSVSKQQGVSFYHIHGLADSSPSICLGYEHYAGILSHLRTEINTKESHSKAQMAIKQILCKEKELNNTWGEKFYTENLNIVGLSMDSCEMDLWWLITHRAYLYYSNYCGLRDVMTNKIVYYDVVDDVKRPIEYEETKRAKQELNQQNKHRLLINDHVVVKKYNLTQYNNSYLEAYHQIFDDIEKKELSIG